MSNPSLFDGREPDPAAAAAARDAGIDQTRVHRDAHSAGLWAARLVARRNADFTSETIRRWVAFNHPDAALQIAKEPRVMGAVMKDLPDKGIAVKTDRTRIEHSTANHNRPQAIWHSLIYTPKEG